jgi:hypothetical protein
MSERVHELKTWPTYWDAVERGEKTFEVRRNDRFFQAGDIVELVRMDRDAPGACYDDSVQQCEKRKLRFRIGPILQGGQFGIESGFCVFSLLPLGPPQAAGAKEP